VTGIVDYRNPRPQAACSKPQLSRIGHDRPSVPEVGSSGATSDFLSGVESFNGQSALSQGCEMVLEDRRNPADSRTECANQEDLVAVHRATYYLV
jgi:hypothetical protein